MLPKGFKVAAPGTSPVAPKPGVKAVAASAAKAVGSAAATGAKAVGKQFGSAAVTAKGTVVSTARNVPAAASNALNHPVAAGKAAVKAVASTVVHNTIGIPK